MTIPEVVERYNRTMGGVDRGDQLILQFEPHFRSVKLWKKILFNLLVTAAGGCSTVLSFIFKFKVPLKNSP